MVAAGFAGGPAVAVAAEAAKVNQLEKEVAVVAAVAAISVATVTAVVAPRGFVVAVEPFVVVVAVPSV